MMSVQDKAPELRTSPFDHRGPPETSHLKRPPETSVPLNERLVGFAGRVELEVDRSSAQDIEREEALATGGLMAAVAVVGEIGSVAFRHRDHGGVFDDHPSEGAMLEHVGGLGVTALDDAVDHLEEECGARLAEGLPQRLARHGAVRECSEVHDEVIEGSVALRDGLEHGEKEPGGAELVGCPLDEAGFAGDPLEFGGGRQKTIFEHVQLARPTGRSSFLFGK